MHRDKVSGWDVRRHMRVMQPGGETAPHRSKARTQTRGLGLPGMGDVLLGLLVISERKGAVRQEIVPPDLTSGPHAVSSHRTAEACECASHRHVPLTRQVISG